MRRLVVKKLNFFKKIYTIPYARYICLFYHPFSNFSLFSIRSSSHSSIIIILLRAAYHWYKNAPTDEEFEKELSKNYSHNIQSSREKHEQMTQFLQNIKDPNNQQQQQRMNEVLLGGRGQQKRLHAVDDSIYGTEEGAKLQKEAQEEKNSISSSSKMIQQGRMKKKRKKKDLNNEGTDGNESGGDVTDKGAKDNTMLDRDRRLKQSVAGLVIAGAVAAGVSIFLGGGRRSSH